MIYFIFLADAKKIQTIFWLKNITHLRILRTCSGGPSVKLIIELYNIYVILLYEYSIIPNTQHIENSVSG